MQLQTMAATHQGRRGNNEDAYATRPELGLFVVADGMGGYDGGEVASRLAVDTIGEFFQRNATDGEATWPYAMDRELSFVQNMLAVAVRVAHDGICRQKRTRFPQMGTTVAALVLAGGIATIGHVGDSRVYRLRDGALERMTRDHSLYEELLASGADLPARGACGFGNVITRALGMETALAELRAEAVRPGDTYLLCTDGLLEQLSDEAIGEALAETPETSCPALVHRAYEAGGRDNITAVVTRVIAL